MAADLQLPVARASVIAAQAANDRYFRFHLAGALPDDPPMVATAGAEPVMDVNGYRSTRKLTLIHAMNTPIEVTFPALGRSVRLEPAHSVVFASFLTAAFAPDATFLVTRVHGAAFS